MLLWSRDGSLPAHAAPCLARGSCLLFPRQTASGTGRVTQTREGCPKGLAGGSSYSSLEFHP